MASHREHRGSNFSYVFFASHRNPFAISLSPLRSRNLIRAFQKLFLPFISLDAAAQDNWSVLGFREPQQLAANYRNRHAC